MNRTDWLQPNGYKFGILSYLAWDQQGTRDALRDALAGLLPDHTTGAVVLWGAVPDFGAQTITAGAIYFKGEIAEVAAGPIGPGLTEGTAYWTITETPNGATLLGQALNPISNADNNGNKSVAFIRRATLVSSPTGNVAYTASFKSYGEAVGARLTTPWQNVTSFMTGSGSTPAPQYRRLATGTVELRGAWVAPAYGSAAWQGIFTLPAGFIPSGERRFSIHSSDPGVNDYFKLRVDAGGIVQAASDTAIAAGKILYLDTIRFSL